MPPTQTNLHWSLTASI